MQDLLKESISVTSQVIQQLKSFQIRPPLNLESLSYKKIEEQLRRSDTPKQSVVKQPFGEQGSSSHFRELQTMLPTTQRRYFSDHNSLTEDYSSKDIPRIKEIGQSEETGCIHQVIYSSHLKQQIEQLEKRKGHPAKSQPALEPVQQLPFSNGDPLPELTQLKL